MAEILRHPGAGAEAPQPPSLPQNIEAEAALLGAMMLDNRIVEVDADPAQLLTPSR